MRKNPMQRRVSAKGPPPPSSSPSLVVPELPVAAEAFSNDSLTSGRRWSKLRPKRIPPP